MPLLKTFYLEWQLKGTHARLFMLLGALFLALAVIGIFIPVIPQVPFAIISAYFFSKGSLLIHLWMRSNKFFGKEVREWEDFKVIRPKMKMIATASMVVAAIIVHFKLDQPWPWIIDMLFLGAMIFVVTRKSKILNFPKLELP